MVQFIERQPGSTGERLMQGLGMAAQSIPEIIGQYQEQKRKQQLMNLLMPQQPQAMQQKQAQPALGMEPQSPGTPGLGIQPQQQAGMQEITAQMPIAAEMLGEHQVAQQLAQERALQQREKTGTEKEFLKTNLASFKESQSKLPELKNTDLRLNRLDTLSKSGKLPGPLFAKLNIGEGGKVRFPALFSKEGQEFVKLITDSAKGAKDSFGARVTNFELDTFLQSLPSLLQSQEGRESVIRDLKIMNDINRLHHQAVVDVAKQAGFKVNPAQLESMVQERVGSQVEKLSSQFISPESVQKSRKDLKSIFGGK